MKNIIKEMWLGTPIQDCLDFVGSRSYIMVQIEHKFGKEVAANTNIETDVMNFTRWHFAGHSVKPGETCFYGVRYEKLRNKEGKVVKRIPKLVRLFHRCQTKESHY